MSDLLLSEGATNKAKEADHLAFLISDVVIPDGTPRLDVVASLADAGIYTTEDDLVYGMDESDSRNERMIIKAVGHLGNSNHRWNEQALTQLAAVWPCSRTTQIELNTYGAYSFSPGGQTMANVAVMPFGGASSMEVARFHTQGTLVWRLPNTLSQLGAEEEVNHRVSVFSSG